MFRDKGLTPAIQAASEVDARRGMRGALADQAPPRWQPPATRVKLELEDGTQLGDYGLSWDYVEPDTFEDQPNGYYRYQISWGGPSEEIRYHDDGIVEFWFLDWFDGACVQLTGDDLEVALWVAEMHIG